MWKEVCSAPTGAVMLTDAIVHVEKAFLQGPDRPPGNSRVTLLGLLRRGLVGKGAGIMCMDMAPYRGVETERLRWRCQGGFRIEIDSNCGRDVGRWSAPFQVLSVLSVLSYCDPGLCMPEEYFSVLFRRVV